MFVDDVVVGATGRSHLNSGSVSGDGLSLPVNLGMALPYGGSYGECVEGRLRPCRADRQRAGERDRLLAVRRAESVTRSPSTAERPAPHDGAPARHRRVVRHVQGTVAVVGRL